MADEENKNSVKKTSKKKASTRKKTASKKKTAAKKTAKKKVSKKKATSSKAAADAFGGADSNANKQEKTYGKLEDMGVIRDATTEPAATPAQSRGLNLPVEFIFLTLIAIFIVVFLAVFVGGDEDDSSSEQQGSSQAVSGTSAGNGDTDEAAVPAASTGSDNGHGMMGEQGQGMITQPGGTPSANGYMPRPVINDMYRPMAPAGTSGGADTKAATDSQTTGSSGSAANGSTGSTMGGSVDGQGNVTGQGSEHGEVHQNAYPTPPPIPGYPPNNYYPPNGYYPQNYQPWGSGAYPMPAGPNYGPQGGNPGWR